MTKSRQLLPSITFQAMQVLFLGEQKYPQIFDYFKDKVRVCYDDGETQGSEQEMTKCSSYNTQC